MAWGLTRVSARALTTTCLNHKHAFLTILKAEKSKIKTLVNPGSDETPSWFADSGLPRHPAEGRGRGASALVPLLPGHSRAPATSRRPHLLTITSGIALLHRHPGGRNTSSTAALLRASQARRSKPTPRLLLEQRPREFISLSPWTWCLEDVSAIPASQRESPVPIQPRGGSGER